MEEVGHMLELTSQDSVLLKKTIQCQLQVNSELVLNDIKDKYARDLKFTIMPETVKTEEGSHGRAQLTIEGELEKVVALA